LRLLAKQNIDVVTLEKFGQSASVFTKLTNSLSKQQHNDFSHEVLEVMDGCLACKACSSQCPVSVDVPGFRARFLNLYYRRYSRPMKDYLVANIETMAPLMAKVPKLVNFFLRQNWFNNTIRKTVGYVDTPHLSVPTLQQRLPNDRQHFDLAQLQSLTKAQLAKKVCIVQDPFTSYYEAGVVEALVQLIIKLGFEPVLLPFMPNGKPQHVKGFLDKFAHTANSAAELLNAIQSLAIPLVGIDPSMVLCYRDEYSKTLGQQRGDFHVLLVHEWLLKLDILPKLSANKDEFALFGHCSEKTALPASESQWQNVFEKFGLTLKPIAVGCCGMAGTFGHEESHLNQSKGLFELSWQQQIEQYPAGKIVATGYSCRSQVARMADFKPKHPLQVLLETLN
jgi:Fe-S oxidoreductase